MSHDYAQFQLINGRPCRTRDQLSDCSVNLLKHGRIRSNQILYLLGNMT